jgi:ADP-dependent NAD(P)H-hydrate dehydratase / NAD(P)H-hydrate epimerase
MTGAALLAASAALHSGAGRVFASLLDGGSLAVDASQPELMFRAWDSLDLSAMAVACGCGGGDSIRAVLPKVFATASALVLDADALNAIAADTQLQTLLQARSRRQRPTVITPHPLEAARLLACGATQVQADRLKAARELMQRFGCVVVLKGSGSIIAAPGSTPKINSTGNARLATAGTGDVLAGKIAARLARGASAFDAAAGAVYAHGLAADQWPLNMPLTAGALAGLSSRT